MASQIPSSDKIQDGIERNYKEAVIQAVFGGEYAQNTPEGIDNQFYISAITLAPLTSAELLTVISFLDGLGGALPFLVPITGEPDMVVTSSGYAKNKVNEDSFTITIGLLEHKFVGVTP